jgi:hypothetical protein
MHEADRGARVSRREAIAMAAVAGAGAELLAGDKRTVIK